MDGVAENPEQEEFVHFGKAQLEEVARQALVHPARAVADVAIKSCI